MWVWLRFGVGNSLVVVEGGPTGEAWVGKCDSIQDPVCANCRWGRCNNELGQQNIIVTTWLKWTLLCEWVHGIWWRGVVLWRQGGTMLGRLRRTLLREWVHVIWWRGIVLGQRGGTMSARLKWTSLEKWVDANWWKGDATALCRLGWGEPRFVSECTRFGEGAPCWDKKATLCQPSWSEPRSVSECMWIGEGALCWGGDATLELPWWESGARSVLGCAWFGSGGGGGNVTLSMVDAWGPQQNDPWHVSLQNC